MAQTMKGTRKPHASATIPVIVMAEPSKEERGELEIKSLPASLRYVPKEVPVEVDKLKANIHDFVATMEPVASSLADFQSNSVTVTSITLALSVGVDGKISLLGFFSGGAQVQAGITVTLAINK